MKENEMGITFQVSLYPIMQNDIRKPINNFIEDLKEGKLDVEVHETSTIGSGNIDYVFDVLKGAYMRASESGDTIMVLTVSNACPTKEELEKLNS